MTKPTVGQMLLMAALFLAAVIGGYFPTDALRLDPDALWSSLSNGQPPIFAHALIALFACGSLVWALATKRVVQVPFQQTLFVCVIFAATILLSMMFSTYRWQAFYTSLEWLSYLVAMGAAAALAGRQRGATYLLWALVAGCTLVSVLGILQYWVTSEKDPNWRIFGTWMNPNALAGMLLLGFFSALGLAAALKKRAALWAGACAHLIGVALLLTQSKGGLLALGIGLAAFAGLGIGWARQSKPLLKPRLPALIVALTFFLTAFGVQLYAAKSFGSETAVLGRVSAAAAQSGQSAGFRKNLWKGSVALMKQYPLGTGGGAYQFVSTKPGLSTGTALTHQTYLQIGVEFGPLALLAFLALGLMWFRDMFRGARKLPPEQSLLRAGVVSAVAASCAHGFIDSDLSFYGNGVAFFILLGIGLQLCADGVTPEAIPNSPRLLGIGTAALIPLALMWFGYLEAQKAAAWGAVEKREIERAREIASSLQGLAGADGSVWYLSGLLEPTPVERIGAFQKAASLTPFPKYYRALARAQTEAGQPTAAIASLNLALAVDPNNMLALKQMIEVYVLMGNSADAKKTAERLVAVEQTSYYTVRSIPEDIPVETFEARLYLAKAEASPEKKIEWLKPAVEGFRHYLGNTLPGILQDRFPGESKETASAAVRVAREVGEVLAEAAQHAGDDATLKDAGAFQEEVLKAMEMLG